MPQASRVATDASIVASPAKFAYTVHVIPQPGVNAGAFANGCTDYLLGANNASHFVEQVMCGDPNGSLTNDYIYTGSYALFPQSFIGYSVNDSDVVAGTSGGNTAARWEAGVVTPLSTTQSAAYSINNFEGVAGSLVPESQPDKVNAAIWPPSGPPLDLTPGNAFAVALSINASNTAIGAAENGSGASSLRTYIFNGGKIDLTALVPAGLRGWSAAGSASINDKGHAAFTELNATGTHYQPFFYDGKNVHAIALFPGDVVGIAKGINNNDAVVGYSCGGRAQRHCRPFVYRKGITTALGTLIPATFDLVFPAQYAQNIAIENNGTIMVIANENDGSSFHSRVLQLTPNGTP